MLASFNTGVVSDGSWLCQTLSGPPTEAVPEWTLPAYDDSAWTPATVVTLFYNET